MGKGLPGSPFLAKMLSRACCSTEICKEMNQVNQTVHQGAVKSWSHRAFTS